MGALAQVGERETGDIAQAVPPLQDLKVTITSTSRISPPKNEDNINKIMFLSNIDQILNFNVETVHFFAANPNFITPSSIVEKMKSALDKLLEHYYYLAGRLRFNEEEGRLEIDCNGAGVGFLVAESELTLEDLGELDYPNTAFRQLTAADPPDALAIFQVTTFKCGGFVLGMTTNHCIFDGLGFKTFLTNLAAVLSGNAIPTIPFNDRRLLAARNPPRITFPHTELIELPPLIPKESQLLTATIFDDSANLEFGLFRLTKDNISTLKSIAGPDVSSFNAVTAHLWRCKVIASGLESHETESTALFAVDMRSRLRPQLPMEFVGNAVMSAVASVKSKELKDLPAALTTASAALKKAAENMNDEYGRSVIDWGEQRRGAPKGDVLVTSWWRLGFSEVVYPWGKPVYVCPVARPNRDIVLLFPSVAGKDGVNVMVALPPENMQRFRSLFYEFLTAAAAAK